MNELTQMDCDALADIIWFIKGRMSACQDRGVSCELESRHIESLRLFRLDFLDKQSGAKT